MATKKKVKAKSRAAVKKSAKKVVKLKAKKPAAKAAVSNGLPRPSTKPWGQAGRALDGVRILDFTHVQSGPTCTQLLAYMGADVIKVERPGVGDITRGQLRDVKGQDSLYFTMLNGSKRSITIDSKHPKGKEIVDRLVKQCDVLVENFAPGALDRMGLTWEHIHKLNPRMVVASVKGFGPGPYEDCKVSASAPAAASACCAPCRTACSISPASSCATSSASATVRSPSIASTARTCRSAWQCRAPATIPVAASRAGS